MYTAPRRARLGIPCRCNWSDDFPQTDLHLTRGN